MNLPLELNVTNATRFGKAPMWGLLTLNVGELRYHSMTHPPLSPRLRTLYVIHQRAMRNLTRLGTPAAPEQEDTARAAWFAAGKAFDDQALAEGWTKAQVVHFLTVGH